MGEESDDDLPAGDNEVDSEAAPDADDTSNEEPLQSNDSNNSATSDDGIEHDESDTDVAEDSEDDGNENELSNSESDNSGVTNETLEAAEEALEAAEDGGIADAYGNDTPESPSEVDEDSPLYDPVQDEEMPLADHIEEMLLRLSVVIVVAGAVTLLVLPFAEQTINFLWNSVLPAGETTRPRVYHPLALVLTKIKVASLAGIIISLPVLVYQTYLFMRPGLYPNERRYYLAAVPTSLVLAFVGVSFAYFLMLPAIFKYFTTYTEGVSVVAYGLTQTFNLILLLMGYLAVIFQIPLLIMLAIMMGLTTRQWMESRRLYFWGAFVGISFLTNFDPTGMAPFMVSATMIFLFEGTLALLRWTGR